MLKAERDLVPNQSAYKFSVELATQMRKVRLLKALINKKANQYPLETYVNWDMEKYAEQWIRLDVPTLEQQLEKERETLIYLQEHSDEGRDTHHDYIIETTADEEHKEIHVIAKEMKARETQARMYKHIGAALNTRHYSSVNKIGIPRDMQNDSTASIWDRFQ